MQAKHIMSIYHNQYTLCMDM